jgi:transcriptional regulator with PAS, ATPase and Fis domain
VLIEGESGTGKELVAAAIHRQSGRSKGPFVPVNCSAIPADLLESEFFGHVRGAFSGAVADALGLFRSAHGGTLFLDEIAEMTPILQAKLLRVLQERSFRTLGGTREQAVDVRVIAATNQDPIEATRQGKLREDLFYRLNVFAIKLPPLRDRKDDIPLLAQSFVKEFAARNGRDVAGVSDEATRVLERYDWPGNVRELRNVIERATIVAKGALIAPGDIPPLAGPTATPRAPAGGLSPGTTVDEAERQLIEITLQHTHGNKTRAAEMLGISLKTLHNKLNRMKAEQGLGQSQGE